MTEDPISEPLSAKILARSEAVVVPSPIVEDVPAESTRHLPEIKRGVAAWWPFGGNRAWEHTAHASGFLPSRPNSDIFLDIKGIGEIKADTSLKN